MATRSFIPGGGTLVPGSVDVFDGYVEINHDGSVPSQTLLGGSGIDNIIHSGTGEYTISLVDLYPGGVMCQVALSCDADVDLVPSIFKQPVENDGTQTIIIHLKTGAVATNPTKTCALNLKITAINSVTLPGKTIAGG